ncbi:P-loop ATPase, Sll1717 family [Fusobacterium massiliense]|uniref:P-loop ATPase, Sll1717 family n=1 Tax=Fusobacterium massiliense TaxID=1852365 RepID=UPI0028D17EA4|nr:hypothetical protein [Fusobacterium massiliense]
MIKEDTTNIDVINLKSVFFGNSDGKNESKNENFLNTFFDYNNMYSELKSGKFLILGSKGSGKTLLLEYFKKNKIMQDGSVFINVDLNEIVVKKEAILKEEGVYHSVSLLKWIIYIDLSKKIIELIDNSVIIVNKELKKIRNFMKKNKFDLNLDSDKIVEKIIDNGFEGTLEYGFLKSVGAKIFKSSKNIIGDYHNYIKTLEDVIIKGIKLSGYKNEIYIVFDELDGIAQKDIDILSDLIDLFGSLNNKWEEYNLKIKLIISMRDDIFKKLTSLNTSKIKEDFGLLLNWAVGKNKSSPLFDLICHKIRNSNTLYKNFSKTEIFKKIFYKTIMIINDKKIDIYSYILGKTFLKPRDIITFFNKLQNKIKDNKKVTEDDVRSILKDYSETILLDIRNQATTLSLSADEFDNFMNILRTFRKTNFTFKEIKEFKKVNKSYNMTIKRLKEIMQIFFELGILGNLKTINEQGNYVFFKYKNNSEINFEERFVIHYGIREVLDLSIEDE